MCRCVYFTYNFISRWGTRKRERKRGMRRIAGGQKNSIIKEDTKILSKSLWLEEDTGERKRKRKRRKGEEAEERRKEKELREEYRLQRKDLCGYEHDSKGSDIYIK